MNRFYTRTGDDGYTGWLGQGRLPKYHPVTEALGAIDEATSALGMGRALAQREHSRTLLVRIQRDLYNLMGEVASAPENAARFRVIDAEKVAWLEQETDRLSESVRLPREFVVPGDSQAGAALSMARAIVRRAERRVARLYHEHGLENVELLRYLNRLSSLCFVLELAEDQASGTETPTLAKE
jgi:cob(I)alamin adenosyltransferase